MRQEFVQLGERMIGNARDTSWNQAKGSTFTNSKEVTKLLSTAAVLQPRSLPKKVQLARPAAKQRSARSVTLVSMDRSGFSQYRVRAIQFFNV
jgi:hypothetical protein